MTSKCAIARYNNGDYFKIDFLYVVSHSAENVLTPLDADEIIFRFVG
jgi:hypothetical protein